MKAQSPQRNDDSLTHRLPWIPRHWHEWLFFAGMLLVLGYLLASSDGSLTDRLRENAIGIGCVVLVIVVWTATAARTRAAEARERGTKYKSWWVPRSVKVRALIVLVGALTLSLIASQADSVTGALQAMVAILALMAVSAWFGSSSNSVELRASDLDVNKAAGVGPMMMANAGSISYADIATIKVKKNGDFELEYLDKGQRDQAKKTSFRIVPERRRDFLEDLRSRVEASRTEGVIVVLDCEL